MHFGMLNRQKVITIKAMAKNAIKAETNRQENTEEYKSGKIVEQLKVRDVNLDIINIIRSYLEKNLYSNIALLTKNERTRELLENKIFKFLGIEEWELKEETGDISICADSTGKFFKFNVGHFSKDEIDTVIYELAQADDKSFDYPFVYNSMFGEIPGRQYKIEKTRTYDYLKETDKENIADIQWLDEVDIVPENLKGFHQSINPPKTGVEYITTLNALREAHTKTFMKSYSSEDIMEGQYFFLEANKLRHAIKSYVGYGKQFGITDTRTSQAGYGGR